MSALVVRLLRKAIWMLIILWGITLISFAVIHLAPGSPTDMQTSLNPLAGELVRARLDAIYGLDRPLLIQYFDWLTRLLHFDFGISLSSDARPVIDKIMERLPLTVGMNVASLALTLIIALPVGIVSAVRQGTWVDKTLTVLVFLGFAMPGFWLALLLMLYFGIDLWHTPPVRSDLYELCPSDPAGQGAGRGMASGPADCCGHSGRHSGHVTFSALFHAGSAATGLYSYRTSQGPADEQGNLSSRIA